MRKGNKSNDKDAISTALAAVALQDHLVRSLSLNIPHRSQNKPSTVKPAPSLQCRAVSSSSSKSTRGMSSVRNENQKEYVLDRKPPPLTLAQRLGLVEAPRQLITEDDWKRIKAKANEREDFGQPCVICKEDLGLQPHVLLSCTHVFHKNCLLSFERFTGRKTCPMCRKEQYQTRVVHEGIKHLHAKCATIIQAAWRGHVVRSWYRKLRKTVPPKDPKLRHKFYEEKLRSITDRMIKSLDYDVNSFISEIDRSIEESHNVFRHLDSVLRIISDIDWTNIEAKAIERGDTECPICLMQLDVSTDDATATMMYPTLPDSKAKVTPAAEAALFRAHYGTAASQMKRRATIAEPPWDTNANSQRSIALLSCSHVFHANCLQALEDFTVIDAGHSRVCPVCRSHYQTKHIQRS